MTLPPASKRSWILAVALASLGFASSRALAEEPPELPRDPILHLDFAREEKDVQLVHGVRRITGTFGGALEFTTALQYAELSFSRRLDGVRAATIGGWFNLRRAGEGAFLFRGVPEIGPLGERRFPPQKDWVNFFLGTDQHGFLMGCVNGNGEMPFPLVTLDELRIDAWHQLVVVREADGGQKFYHNGVLVHTDADSCWAGKVRPFHDTEEGEPLRLALPQGGLLDGLWRRATG